MTQCFLFAFSLSIMWCLHQHHWLRVSDVVGVWMHLNLAWRYLCVWRCVFNRVTLNACQNNVTSVTDRIVIVFVDSWRRASTASRAPCGAITRTASSSRSMPETRLRRWARWKGRCSPLKVATIQTQTWEAIGLIGDVCNGRTVKRCPRYVAWFVMS